MGTNTLSKLNIQSIAFACLQLYTVLFLVGTHIFNPIMRVLFVILFALTLLVKNPIKYRLEGYIKYMGLFVLLAAASILWSEYKNLAYSGFSTIFRCSLLGLCIYIQCDTREKLTRILFLFMIGVLLLDAYCIITLGFRGLVSLGSQDLRLGLESGTELNSNFIGTTNVLGVMLALFFYSITKKRYVVLLIITYLLFVALAASRSSFICLAFGYLLFSLFIKKGNKILRIPLYVIIAMGLIIIANRLGLLDKVLKRFGEASKSVSAFFSGDTTSSNSNIRLRLIYEGLKLFIKRPLFGYGTGQFGKLISGLFSVDYAPHNAYIQAMVSYGILGLIFWQGMYFRNIKFYYKNKDDVLARFLFVLYSVWLLNDMFGHSISNKTSYFLLAVGFAYCAVRKKELLVIERERREFAALSYGKQLYSE